MVFYKKLRTVSELATGKLLLLQSPVFPGAWIGDSEGFPSLTAHLPPEVGGKTGIWVAFEEDGPALRNYVGLLCELEAWGIMIEHIKGARVEGARVIRVKGVNVWQDVVVPIGSLAGADLYNACLDGQYIQHVDWNGINLMNARLRLAVFKTTDLSGANLQNANLTGAIFEYVNLSDANLQNAILTNAKFHNSNLSGADFRNAHISGIQFYGTPTSCAHWENTTGTPIDYYKGKSK